MKAMITSKLSQAINKYLQLDPTSTIRLNKLAGKIIAIELKPFGYTFYCHFSDQGVQINDTALSEVNTQISGTPIQFVNVMLDKTNRKQFFTDDVNMTGDAEVGQQVIQLFDELEIDWEEYLAKLIGDIPAFNISKFVNRIGNWLQSSNQSLRENVNEYIHEEANWLPTREALQDFYRDIDQLRLDADRLEARLTQLLNRAKS